MKLLVQKFGGTSVATKESREFMYKKIEAVVSTGTKTVVVVSAMGRRGSPYATDTLMDMIKENGNKPSSREQDMIFVCGEIISGSLIASELQTRGHKAIFLTGQQAGIITNGYYTDARIVNIETSKIKQLLDEGYIVIVGGGQGASIEGEITILGRGGSDTTGCALGVALDADEIIIYTDVEGIMTGDPRKIKKARLLRAISYKDCCTMAYQGAKVMHPRAVEEARKKKQIKLYVRSTFSDDIGTRIDDIEIEEEEQLVGIASTNEQSVLVMDHADIVSEEAIRNEIKEINQEDYSMVSMDNQCIMIATEKVNQQIEGKLNHLGVSYKKYRDMVSISLIGSHVNKSTKYKELVEQAMEQLGVEPLFILTNSDYIRIIMKNEKIGEVLNTLHEII